MNEKELVAADPSSIISQAISNGANLEQLEKLLSIKERWEANEAKKAYHKAMAAFKLNPPEIEKDRKVAFGQTKYSHATLANVTKKISKTLSDHGFSASWSFKQETNLISVTCKITHELGHSEETTLGAPADTSGSKNAIQAIGSTLTYLERYSLLALTGLAAQDADDDARKMTIDLISADEVKALEKQLKELDLANDLFVAYMGVSSIESIAKTDLKKAQIALDKKRASLAPKR